MVWLWNGRTIQEMALITNTTKAAKTATANFFIASTSLKGSYCTFFSEVPTAYFYIRKVVQDAMPAVTRDSHRLHSRMTIFEDEDDYVAFKWRLEEAVERAGMRLPAFCVMPNNWHLVLWAR